MLSRRAFIASGLMAAAGFALYGCGSNESQQERAESVQGETAASAATSSVLVVYYSATGHTQKVADAIATKLGADTFEIQPKEAYSTDDLDYNDDSSRVCQEYADKNRVVELAQVTPSNFAEYETVFIGYPIWWGDASWVVDSFVKDNDFDGKTVIPFCTSASSELGDSADLLAEMSGTGAWQAGMRFSSSVDAADVEEWVEGLEL